MTGRARERARIGRLLWRAGFGGLPREVDRMAAMGLEAAVADLLRPRGAILRGRPARVEGRPLDPFNAYGHDVLWWLDRAVRARHPLVERMTLNWHDHFATSAFEVAKWSCQLRVMRSTSGCRARTARSSHQSTSWP